MKNIKTLLMFPPMTIYGEDISQPATNPPLGLAYIASYIKNKNTSEVKIIDALTEGIENIQNDKKWIRYGLSEKQIKNEIKKYNPNIVGINSMYTAYARDAHVVARLAKEVDKNILTVMGGAHASISPKYLLKDKNLDLVVYGEGEVTFNEIVKSLSSRKFNPKKITGIGYKKNEKIIINKPRQLIKDLDTIPFPARDLLPMKKYFKYTSNRYIMAPPSTQVITSRGCPGNCVFCSIHSVWGHTWRMHKAKYVVNEIEQLINDYKINEVAFIDDNMTLSKKRTNEICNEILKRKIKIKWTTPNGTSHWSLDNETIRKMKKAGCYRVTFGIESGSKITRRYIKKTHDLNQAKRVIKQCNKAGLWTICTFIIGFPYETKKEMDKTLKFAIDSGTDFALFYLAMPFPGTKMYEDFKKERLINFDKFMKLERITPRDLSNLGAALSQFGCNTRLLTKIQLQKIQEEYTNIFWTKKIKSFMNPLKIINKIRSIDDLKYVLKLINSGVKVKVAMLKQGRFTPQLLYESRKKE